jgi:hypothetical protein
MTALGPVRLERSHASCKGCGQPAFPADALLGLDGWLTRRALEMAVRAGVHEPFRRAESLLADLAGWSVDADTLRRRCHEQARAAAEGREGRAALPEAFARAGGDFELHIDAGKVFGTDKKWHDIKLGVALKRERGEPADSATFARRELPAPAARSVVAAVETRQDFGVRLEAEALRLGMPLGKGLSVLGDGAEWIRDIAADHFHPAACVLDFWHAAQHLAAAGRAGLGETAAMRAWLEEAKRAVAADGYAGACEALAKAAGPEGVMGPEVVSELNYFAGQQGRMGYAVRLRRGQAIGSGAVEGAIKQLVNLRVKRTAARWTIERVGPFVELLAMAGTAEWREHWDALAS